jgi:hypothetical protein
VNAYLRTHIRDLEQVGRLLCAVLMLAILGMCVLYFKLGSNPFFNEETLLLSVLLLSIMVFSVVLAGKPLHVPVIVLIFVLASTCIPGIYTLLLISETVATPLPLTSVELVNAGVLYFCVTLLIFFICFLGAGRFRSRIAAFEHPLPQVHGSSWILGNGRNVLGLLFVVLGVALLSRLPFSLGLTLYHEGPELAVWRNTLLQLILLAFDIDSIALLALFLLCRMDMPSKTRWLAISAVALIYLAATMSGGSRSGLVRLLVYGLLITLVLEIRFKARLRSLVLSGIFLVVSAMLVFSTGTQIRHELAFAEQKNGKWKQTPAEQVPEEDVGRNWLKVGAEFSSRVASSFYYAIQTTTHQSNEAARQQYFTLEYAAKNFVNNLPGTPYPEAKVSTSRVFGVIYRGQTEEQIQKHGYFSEFYTVTGLAYLYFGHAGGLLAVAAAGVVLGLLFIKVYRLKRERPVLQLWALFALPGGVITTQGLDHTLWILLISAIRFQISYKLLQMGIWLSQHDNAYKHN